MKFVKLIALSSLSLFCPLLYADKKFEAAIILSKVVEISSEELQKDLAEGQTILLINVLQKHIYKDCSIWSSVNIPIEKLLTNKLLKQSPKHRKIIIYSATRECPVSTYAFRILKKHGFTNVYVYQGGMRDWYQKQLPCKGKCKAGYLKG